MMKTNQFKALAVVAATALALCLLALVAVQPAGAAFPGNNGKIAFQSTRDASVEIYTVNSSGGTATRITFPFGGNAEAAYSPDGSRIAFQRAIGGAVGDIRPDIYVMNADGSGLRSVTNDDISDFDPAWSPDGTRVAFTRQNNIYVIGADGTGMTKLTSVEPDSANEPAWSPDGSKIAFTSSRDGPFEIYVMNADGSNPINVTNHSATEEGLVWSGCTAP